MNIGEGCKLVQVPVGSNEYDEVETRIKLTCQKSCKEIMKVRLGCQLRHQDKLLHKKFLRLENAWFKHNNNTYNTAINITLTITIINIINNSNGNDNNGQW